jgi:dihydroorotase-like cyclic amidohydrolase
VSPAKRTADLAQTPGFIDLHAHLREPGSEDSETIATGLRAALRGGFTTVCAMPNTEPAVDTPDHHPRTRRPRARGHDRAVGGGRGGVLR